jgi:DNA-binding protein H-NS
VRTSQRERKNDNFGIYAGKIRELEQRAEALIAKQSSGVIEKIRKLMAEHGLTAADIEGHAGGKGRAKKVGAKTVNKGGTAAVKYCDPKSGATWTGHGRAPQWIASAKNRDKFLVDGGKATATAASKAKAAGNYVRGPQPALYRDPKSGATWSGRGRAPAWPAGAKERSKFLIDGVSGVADSAAASKPKAVAKKPATTTAVAKKAPVKKLVGAKKAVTKLPVATAPEPMTAQATA